MLDTLYGYYSRKKEKPLDPRYKPSDAIIGRKFLNGDANKLAVVFPGWHTHNFPINILARRLVRQGWAVLVYDFHDQIMEPDEDIVTASFYHVRESICAELNQLLDKHSYDQVHFISISLGGVPLGLVCDKFHRFTSVTAVVGGDNLAIDMWYGMRTQHFRRAFQKMHIGVRRLASDWDDLAPDSHLRHFKNKPVKLVISLRDNFVRTRYQKSLARKLREVGALVRVKRHLGGHVATVVLFCLFGSPL